MGRVVTFAQLPADRIGQAVERAAITSGDVRQMAAELVRIEPGGIWTADVPDGCDCYLFMLAGAATISSGNGGRRLPAQAFAVVAEGSEFTIENDAGSFAQIVKVLAPPPDAPVGRPLAGFRGKVEVVERDKAQVVALPQEKKQRIYFAGGHAAKTERGHAMIVIYQKDTVTGLHHHPDAESMFVMLHGALRFTVNGEQVTVEPGQAAYFGVNDRHGLRVADGHGGASFLEFHIPAAFTTVRERE